MVFDFRSPQERVDGKPETRRLRVSTHSWIEVPVSRRPGGVSSSEWNKVCRINDQIVRKVTYDVAKAESGEPRGIQSPAETLRRGMGVCVDYSALFEAAALRAGITVASVYSDKLNHAWNMVQFGGTSWAVDVTWNAGSRFQGGRTLPESVRLDVDFRRRYLLTTYESELLLASHGVLNSDHLVDDVRRVNLVKTVRANVLIERIELLIDRRNVTFADLGLKGDPGKVITVAQRKVLTRKLYDEYLALEKSYPLAVRFRLSAV